MGKFIHIRSAKFPILPGEKEELVNEGMYGRALAEYLQARVRDRGYEALQSTGIISGLGVPRLQVEPA